ncbi:unnamed protein product [Onchocerca flexuosa]|uniref:Uncharacterized protein n=1 Tax=Onchocerca flexuosa TaxID=387005 RepID=A0A183I1Z9_9BILA|nr:unnamed protein product [Onchocerca flexuosa]
MNSKAQFKIENCSFVKSPVNNETDIKTKEESITELGNMLAKNKLSDFFPNMTHLISLQKCLTLWKNPTSTNDILLICNAVPTPPHQLKLVGFFSRNNK